MKNLSGNIVFMIINKEKNTIVDVVAKSGVNRQEEVCIWL